MRGNAKTWIDILNVNSGLEKIYLIGICAAVGYRGKLNIMERCRAAYLIRGVKDDWFFVVV